MRGANRYHAVFHYFFIPIPSHCVLLPFHPHDWHQAMQYFWRVLDVDCTGRLTVGTINLFFRDVARMLKEGGLELPLIADVKVTQVPCIIKVHKKFPNIV